MCRSKSTPLFPQLRAVQVSLRLCTGGTNPTQQEKQTSKSLKYDARSSRVSLRSAAGDEQEQHWDGNDWGQKQRSIYLNPWESRQPWKSWLSLHRKSVTCYSRAELSPVRPRFEARRGSTSSTLSSICAFSDYQVAEVPKRLLLPMQRVFIRLQASACTFKPAHAAMARRQD